MNEPNAKTAAADSSRQSDVQGSLGGVPPVTSSSSATKESDTWESSAGPAPEALTGARVKQTLSSARDSMKQNYRAVSESVDDFVHESPWKAITVAALGGIVIGMLAAR
jgi:ElaB protein